VLVAVALLVVSLGGAAVWVAAHRSDGLRARSANPEAVQLYVKGLAPLEEFGNLAGADKALQQFQAAVARDPHFGPGYAGIAMAYLQKMMYQSQPAVFRAEAEQAITRAIAEDPGSADGYMVLGRLRGFYDWDWSAAEDAFQRGLARHPVTTFPRHYYAVHLLVTGRPHESVQFARETLQLAPTSRAAKVTLAQTYMSLEQNAEAAALAEQTLAQDPAFSVMRRLLASALVTIDPVRAIEQSRLVTVPDPANVLAIQAGIMACAGRRGDAIQLRSQLLALRDAHYVRPTRFALLETCLGNTDDALSWLEQAVEDHELDIAMVQAWRWADPLRGDPRFARILDRLHLPAPVEPDDARTASTVH
jgi:serine/threonine-protein kinase